MPSIYSRYNKTHINLNIVGIVRSNYHKNSQNHNYLYIFLYHIYQEEELLDKYMKHNYRSKIGKLSI